MLGHLQASSSPRFREDQKMPLPWSVSQSCQALGCARNTQLFWDMLDISLSPLLYWSCCLLPPLLLVQLVKERKKIKLNRLKFLYLFLILHLKPQKILWTQHKLLEQDPSSVFRIGVMQQQNPYSHHCSFVKETFNKLFSASVCVLYSNSIRKHKRKPNL